MVGRRGRIYSQSSSKVISIKEKYGLREAIVKKLVTVLALFALAVTLIASACSAAAPRTTVTPGTSKYAPSTTLPKPTITMAGPTYAPTTVPRPTSAPRPGTSYPATTQIPAPTYTVPSTSSQGKQDTIGLAVGGAKDINSFRANIQNNYLPLPTDVTTEGLFYDYYFDTGLLEPSAKLFSPSYSYAVTRDPLSQQNEYYLSVGLISGLKEEDFSRKKLNLVIVVDDSGSMGEMYNQYYYDALGQQQDAYADAGITRLTKMASADDAVVSILNQLNDGDRFAIVGYNSSASVIKSMGPVSGANMEDVRNKVLNIRAGGGTSLSAGMNEANAQFRGLREVSSYEYENRMIILTDAQPNTGELSVSGLTDMMAKNAGSRIYTTFIGIGVDFNSDLVDGITKVKGANYYTVHSPREFRQRMDEEFDFMVTPLIFNLSLNFQSRGWRIDKVFGSPEADQATGQLMKINTLFPSKTEGGETRGGLVLLKLRKMAPVPDDKVYLTVTYEDRNGRTDSSEQGIWLEGRGPEYFDNTGIRKGVLLSRYASLLQNWMVDERSHAAWSRPWDPRISEDTGIVVLPDPNLGQWERQSLPLMVSDPYRRIFSNFSGYFENEMNAIGDVTLDQEIGILNKLSR
jgi:Ca-activated chloride channel homolog